MFLLRIRGLQNYPEAFKQYEAYLKIVNNKDNATVYNTAYCATKIKNYAAAEKYFDMSIKNNYKGASSYLGKAQAQKSQNKTAEMLTQGLASLASLYFNNGAKILQAATPIANSDKAKYDAEKAKAVNDFKKAKDYLVQAQSLDPANQDVKDLMKQVNEALK